MATAATDVIVVGGGLAGATLALLLGRRGVRVSLFEQHRFPRDKPCAEGLMPMGVAVLDRLGIPGLQRGAKFTGIRHHGFGRSLNGRFPTTAHVPGWGRAERRLHLDATLFTAARNTPGVTAHEDARVDDLIIESGRVRGITVDGQAQRAALVVAADGPRSILRRRLGLDRKVRGRPRLGLRRHYRLPVGQTTSDMVESMVDIFVGDDHEIYVTPLPDGEISVAALAYRDVAGKNQSLGARDFFARALEAHAPLRTLLDGATAISELGGRVPLVQGASRGVVPGFVLLGDAAAALDPITGGGMAQALLSAELLAARLTQRPAGDASFNPSDDVLAAFDRDRAVIYREAAALSAIVLSLTGRPRVASLALRLMKRAPALHAHLIGAAAGAHTLADI
jgi:flavin-dependent dehydrogenase